MSWLSLNPQELGLDRAGLVEMAPGLYSRYISSPWVRTRPPELQVLEPAPQFVVPQSCQTTASNLLGLGLGATTTEVSPTTRAELTKVVNQVYANAKILAGKLQAGARDAGTMQSLAVMKAQIAALREQLMSRWEGESSGWVGPAYESWSSLNTKLRNASNLVLNAEPFAREDGTGRFAPGTITSSGAARVYSPGSAFRETFLDEAGKSLKLGGMGVGALVLAAGVLWLVTKR